MGGSHHGVNDVVEIYFNAAEAADDLVGDLDDVEDEMNSADDQLYHHGSTCGTYCRYWYHYKGVYDEEIEEDIEQELQEAENELSDGEDLYEEAEDIYENVLRYRSYADVAVNYADIQGNNNQIIDAPDEGNSLDEAYHFSQTVLDYVSNCYDKLNPASSCFYDSEEASNNADEYMDEECSHTGPFSH
jgi:hypothetical protein